jgi:flavin reductase (DIM6/NTAB) family NADH-FMN oxidoreductase RutF
MFQRVDPAILYFGTPVVLISSENEDGSTNVAPMSSAWWLGKSCLLGFGARSHTPQNILRTGECVVNLPSVDQAAAVDRLAKTTGSNPVPPHKQAMGYRHEPNKLGCGELDPLPSLEVRPPRLAQCPVQLEARLVASLPLAGNDPLRKGFLIALEMQVVAIHVDRRLLVDGTTDRIDPDRWRPLMMSFCRFYGLGDQVHPSRLAEIPESAYRPRPAASAVAPEVAA